MFCFSERSLNHDNQASRLESATQLFKEEVQRDRHLNDDKTRRRLTAEGSTNKTGVQQKCQAVGLLFISFLCQSSSAHPYTLSEILGFLIYAEKL